jgi:RNA polymerase sigma-70 factor (ECF subfamily)
MTNDQTAQIWTAFSDRLRSFIRKRVPIDEDADDILQDVFCKIHERLHQLQDAEKLQAWLYQVTRRAVIDHYRRRGATPEASELPDDLADESEPVPVLSELAECLQPMIERLPESYRQAVIMSELQGLKQKDVAAALGVSLSGAKSRVQRARARLKEMLLACCHVEFDRQGRPLDYAPREPTCGVCTKTHL